MGSHIRTKYYLPKLELKKNKQTNKKTLSLSGHITCNSIFEEDWEKMMLKKLGTQKIEGRIPSRCRSNRSYILTYIWGGGV